MVMCWAPDCKHYNEREKCRFFRFPKDGKERSKWIRLLRRDIEPGPGAFVCSCHFRDGKKENGPEIFLHNISKRFQFPPTPKKKKKSEVVPGVEVEESISTPPSPPTIVEEGPSTSTEKVYPLGPSTSKQTVQTSMALDAEIYFLKKEVEDLSNKMKYMSVRFTYENIQASDKLIVLYTGLPNSAIFEALFKLINNIEINYYFGWTVQKVKKIDQLLLTLMKLRMNMPQLDLAQRFSISQGCVSNIFLTYLHILYEILYQQFMSTMPTRHKNKTCLPNCFSSFTNCRTVLDCTEIFTVVARKSMYAQRLTYSNYKHRNTYKGLLGVAPNGVITYVSDLYVGSTSDQKIVKNCGILQLLEAGDLILADKGFLIQDILPVGVSLNIPPFLRTPQFTPEQIKCTQNIARARIHVERAIRRMKCYNILSFMSESMCPYGDVVFKTVAALTNLQYPLIKEVSELFTSDYEDSIISEEEE